MERFIIITQARSLWWVGVFAVAISLWYGADPDAAARRGALAALLAAILAGTLSRIFLRIVEESHAQQAVEPAEQATQEGMPSA